MKILITGDSGFIGSFSTKKLQAEGFEINGIDIDPQKKYPVDYPYIVGNILDAKALERCMQGVECIIHLAAEHKDFGISKEQYYAVNQHGMETLLSAANKFGIKKILFFSSVVVYGDHQPSNELTEPSPINHYGASKLAGEKVLRQWAEENNERSAVILRPVVVFGPSNKANIYRLIKMVCDKKFIWIGDGKVVKSIAYVENIVDAALFLLNKMKTGIDVFNYSDEPHLTTERLVQLIAQKAKVKVPKFKIPLAPVQAVTRLFDVFAAITKKDIPITSARILKFNTATEHHSSKIREMGFQSQYSIDYGIEQYVRWYFEDKKNTAR
ncbi:MAG: NAD(P)-dependent oxidoreductase [Bacteroidetes bacterium]|nr:NAD(P)-dependent oxidoreductase [Bacteroidota bacterium]